MKKIKPFNVFGEKYKITVDTLTPGIVGLCDKASKRIFIDSNLKDKEFEISVMVHEATHALLHESNIDQVISPEVEEMICMMSEKLVKIFKISLR